VQRPQQTGSAAWVWLSGGCGGRDATQSRGSKKREAIWSRPLFAPPEPGHFRRLSALIASRQPRAGRQLRAAETGRRSRRRSAGHWHGSAPAGRAQCQCSSASASWRRLGRRKADALCLSWLARLPSAASEQASKPASQPASQPALPAARLSN